MKHVGKYCDIPGDIKIEGAIKSLLCQLRFEAVGLRKLVVGDLLDCGGFARLLVEDRLALALDFVHIQLLLQSGKRIDGFTPG